MRFVINREAFVKALTIATRPVGSKTVLPILMKVKMVLDEEGLSLIGSNQELAIKTCVPFKEGEVEIIRDYKEGATLVDGRLITEIAKRCLNNELSFEIIDDTILRITDNQSEFQLNCTRVEEYPDIDLEETGTSFELSGQELMKAADQTVFAASTKEQRPVLMSVNFESDQGLLILTATDSARMSKKEIHIGPSEKFSANVPAKTFMDVTRLFDGIDKVKVCVGDKKILFTFGRTVISTRLITGDYPNTRNIIPKGFNYTLEVNASELVSAMERVSLLSEIKESTVKMSLSEEGVSVSSRNLQIGSANESISTFNFTGGKLEVSFNSSYLIAAIKAAQSEDVVIQFLGEMKPFVVRGAKDDSVVQLVTPLRTH